MTACHPATAQDNASVCAPPPPWPPAGAKPGQPDIELAACLKDRAYRARDVIVPLKSKAAGIIAQCEVDIDRFEGAMVFDGASLSDERLAAIEREAEQEATAAALAYQPCAAR